MSDYEKLAEEFCTCGTDPSGSPVWSSRCPTHRMRSTGFSEKRLELFLMGRSLLGLVRTLSESPYFPNNPYNMTFADLIKFINDELYAMNERSES